MIRGLVRLRNDRAGFATKSVSALAQSHRGRNFIAL
jgi:hypothetical protein